MLKIKMLQQYILQYILDDDTFVIFYQKTRWYIFQSLYRSVLVFILPFILLKLSFIFSRDNCQEILCEGRLCKEAAIDRRLYRDSRFLDLRFIEAFFPILNWAERGASNDFLANRKTRSYDRGKVIELTRQVVREEGIKKLSTP